MVRIPEEYQEVEYIESTGTQWINTNILLNIGCIINITFYIEENNINRVICGWRRTGTYRDKYQAYLGANQNKVRYVAIGRHTMISNPEQTYGHAFNYEIINEINIDSMNKQILINNNKVDCGENFDLNAAFNSDGSSEYYPYLFALNNCGSVLAISSNTKIYKYSVEYENDLIQNLIPCYRKTDNEIGMYDTISKTFYTNSGTGTFLKGHNVYYNNDANLLEQRRKILLNTPHLKTIQDNIATFNTDIKFPLKECKIYFTPKQEGSGDPSPQNVRPISGWDEINIYHTGKNFFPIESGMRGGSANLLLKANQTYTGSTKGNGGYIQLYYQDGSKSSYLWVNQLAENGRKYRVFQPALDTKKVEFFLGGQMVQEMMIERGDVIPKNFKSYQSQTSINIPFSQPIYGGYIDLIKGEIVSEYCTFVLDGVNNYVSTVPTVNQYNMACAYSSMGIHVGLRSLPKGQTSNLEKISAKSDKYIIPIGPNGTNSQVEGVFCGSAHSYIRLVVSVDKLSDVSNGTAIVNSLKQWLQENPIQITYKMAEPIIYPLTPQSITSFKGINNIFSDANGNVEIKFLAH